MKWYRSRHPSAKFSLQYDRLFVDKRIFVFNEMSGRVEEQQGPGGGGGSGGLSTSPSNYYAATSESDIYSDLDQQQQLIRKKSSGRRRLQKSFSNESALNQVGPRHLCSAYVLVEAGAQGLACCGATAGASWAAMLWSMDGGFCCNQYL